MYPMRERKNAANVDEDSLINLLRDANIKMACLKVNNRLHNASNSIFYVWTVSLKLDNINQNLKEISSCIIFRNCNIFFLPYKLTWY